MRAVLALSVLLLAGILFLREMNVRRGTLFYTRSFYGSLRVENERTPAGIRQRTLVHGTTVHGSELLDPARANELTGYYGPTSGIGRAFASHRSTPIRVGIVGLGAGVLAAFCRPGDSFHFYEIDPLIYQVAQDWFGFLKRCPAADVALGDARLVIAAEPPQAFDLLIVDAFSGDSVPIHLLTKEAFELYRRHLKPGALLAMHVSNRFLNLEPVVASAAQDAGHTAWGVFDNGDLSKGYVASQWILVSETAELPVKDTQGVRKIEPIKEFRRWTDDYVNVSAVLE